MSETSQIPSAPRTGREVLQEIEQRLQAAIAGERIAEIVGDIETDPQSWVAELAERLGRVASWGNSLTSWEEMGVTPEGLEARRSMREALAGLAACAMDAAVVIEAQVCRVCGCTHDNPCEGGCGWHELGLCTACVPGTIDYDANHDEDDDPDQEVPEVTAG